MTHGNGAPVAPLIGRRHDAEVWDESIQPGDYGRTPKGEWWVAVPFGQVAGGAFIDHQVTEHDDGTITVDPSILVYPSSGFEGFHGWLRQGVWTW